MSAADGMARVVGAPTEAVTVTGWRCGADGCGENIEPGSAYYRLNHLNLVVHPQCSWTRTVRGINTTLPAVAEYRRPG